MGKTKFSGDVLKEIIVLSDLERYLNAIPALIVQCPSIRFLLFAMDCCLDLEELQWRRS